jgi:hypothetical protein
LDVGLLAIARDSTPQFGSFQLALSVEK